MFKEKGELLQVDIEPGTRIVWLDRKFEREFSNKLSEANRLYHSTELEMVARGYREATTANLRPQTFEKEMEALIKKGLIFLPITRTKTYQGFAHKHVFTTGDDPDSMVYGVVARTLESAELFREYSQGRNKGEVNHSGIGELLGYPSCCRSFFDKVWSEDLWVDTIYHQALNSPGHKLIGDYTVEVKGDPLCNQALRYFGLRITPQLCCSWDCEETKRWGKLWYDTMKDLNKEVAEFIYMMLSTPMTWDCLKGIAICTTPYFYGVTNSVPCYPKHVMKYLGPDTDE